MGGKDKDMEGIQIQDKVNIKYWNQKYRTLTVENKAALT